MRTLRYFLFLFIAAQIAPAAFFLFSCFDPLYPNDYPLANYLMHRAVDFFGASWNLWGLDPFYAAGFPLDFVWNNSPDIQFLAVLLHPLPTEWILRAALFAYLAMAPLVFWKGLANFGLEASARRLGTLLMILYFWTGLPGILFMIGMQSSILVFELGFLTISYFYRYIHDEDDNALGYLYILTPFACLSHKTSVVVIGLPLVALCISHARSLRGRRAFHLIGICAVTLAANSFWLIPLLHLMHYKTTLPEAPHWLCTDPLRIFKDYFTFSKVIGHKIVDPTQTRSLLGILVMNTLLRDVLLFLGLFRTILWWRSGDRRAAGFFSSVILLLLSLIYFGSFWNPTAQLNPVRYIVILDFLLAAPAVLCVADAFAWFMGNRGTPPRFSADRWLPGSASLLLFLIFIPGALIYLTYLKDVNLRLPEDVHALTKHLRQTAPSGGRVLLEDSGWNDRGGGPPRYGGGQYPAMLSRLTGREFIGGPYPYLFVAHHYADFRDGNLFEKQLVDYSDRELSSVLDLYNIEQIVCWTHECISRFRKSEFFETKHFGRFYIFSQKHFVNRPFLVGSGLVIPDWDGLHCYNVKPSRGRAILKYHAFDQIITSEGRHTNVQPTGDDPIGFLRIERPYRYFLLKNVAYGLHR